MSGAADACFLAKSGEKGSRRTTVALGTRDSPVFLRDCRCILLEGRSGESRTRLQRFTATRFSNCSSCRRGSERDKARKKQMIHEWTAFNCHVSHTMKRHVSRERLFPLLRLESDTRFADAVLGAHQQSTKIRRNLLLLLTHCLSPSTSVCFQPKSWQQFVSRKALLLITV